MNKLLLCLSLAACTAVASDSIAKLKLACDIGKESACVKLAALNNESKPTINLNTSKLTSSPKKQIQDKKNIIVTGYGINREQALGNAFKAAIEQYVGVVISSDAMMKNGKLIKDEILTASNGYIETYDVLSENQDNGLYEVKINALVKSQKVYKKIKNLNIPTLTVYNAQYAAARIKKKPIKNNTFVIGRTDEPTNISTANKTKADIENILRKSFENLFSAHAIKDMLKIEVENVKIFEDDIKNGKVPIRVDYRIGIDETIYENRIKQLYEIFNNLGGKYYPRVDITKPNTTHYGVPTYFIGNKKIISNFKASDLGIFRKYGKSYKVDVWSFPENWKTIYPFNKNFTIKLENKINFSLLIKDGSGEVIDSNVLIPKRKEGYHYRIEFGLLTGLEGIGTFYPSYGKNRNIENSFKVITPTLMTNSPSASAVPLYPSVLCSHSQKVDIDTIEKMKFVTIEADTLE